MLSFSTKLQHASKSLNWLLALGLTSTLMAQPFGDPTFRKHGIHDGNKVRTIFFNYGLVAGTVGGAPEGEWPIGSGNMYIGDVSPLLGVEGEQSWIDTFRYAGIGHDTLMDRQGDLYWKFDYLGNVSPPVIANGDTFSVRARVYHLFHSVGTSDGPRGWTDGPSSGGVSWTFEPIPGYANPDTDLVALSTDLDNDGPDGIPSSGDDDGLPDSWPSYWPDKLNDQEDPGWPGSWNGYFGKNVKNADQESYFRMDDNNDREFNYRLPGNPASGIVFRPDSVNDLRFGMALETAVRGLQWSHFLAEDAIFWLYDVTNKGTTDYQKAAFGMMVGTLAGGRCGDSNDDLAYFDAENSITYSFDAPPAYSPCFTGPVGYAGYAFLESPGNPFDGIDNDNDDEEGTAPLFTASDFDSVVYHPGDVVIAIDEHDFSRQALTVGSDTLEFLSQGRLVQLVPGVTVFKEVVGNLLDDDLDGLIDEDTLNHYANRVNRVPPLEPLPPLRYWDFRQNLQITDLMLDESRADGIDNDGDWNPVTDDVGLDGVPATGDYGEGDGQPTSGYIYRDGQWVDTGLPGEPHIDKTDVSESDQIGLTSFVYFTPPGKIRMNNDEQLWSNMTPGINVAEDIETNPVDGDFIYAASFFPLPAKHTQRFSVALVFGQDFQDILNNKITIQEIYDNNYNFARPPDKPLVRAVAGDHKVTLYWDDAAEYSYDPVNGYDFEGYKIYRATDFGFNEINTITDGFGTPVFYEPIAQFDLRDGIKGFFRGDPDRVNGAPYYLGDDTGLRHAWTDTTVVNGQRYFYAVVSYDYGNVEKNIYPAECSKTIIELKGQLTFDKNTVEVTPNATVAGYEPPSYSEVEHLAGDANGTLEISFLDETAVQENAVYEVHFTDMSTDLIDNDGDWIRGYDLNGDGQIDSSEIIDDVGADGIGPRIWTQVNDSVWTAVNNPDYPGPDVGENDGKPTAGEPNLDLNDREELVEVTTGYTVIRTMNGQVDTLLKNSANFHAGNADYSFLQDNVGLKEPDIRQESLVIDGGRYIFDNFWRVGVDLERTHFSRDSNQVTPQVTVDIDQFFNNKGGSNRIKMPHDYEVIFYDHIVDTSLFYSAGFFRTLPETPINFKVYDLTAQDTMRLVGFKPVSGSRDFLIYIFHETASADSFNTWYFKIEYGDSTVIDSSGSTTVIQTVPDLGGGDTLWVYTTKPFSHRDVFRYVTHAARTTSLNSEDWAAKVRVVPNPYLAAASWEPVNRFSSGRGERRIDFIHLPPRCTIRIYNIRGELIRVLQHDGNIFDGTVSWDLRTSEGLDIAYGVYLYHIDAGENGQATGKFAIIK